MAVSSYFLHKISCCINEIKGAIVTINQGRVNVKQILISFPRLQGNRDILYLNIFTKPLVYCEYREEIINFLFWLEILDFKVERAKGIEPSYPAWEAGILPLNYARIIFIRYVTSTFLNLVPVCFEREMESNDY